MASNVNTRFVLIAGIITVCAVGGVGFVGYRMMNVGGEQNISRGDTFAKSGDLKKAINEYGRAVNKDRGNAEWIRTWLGAIEKYTPPTRQQYDDMYRQDYSGALRILCEADRGNIEPFKRVLEERYQIIVRTGGNLVLWEGLARDHDDLLKLFRGDQKSKEILGRYHGLARAGMLSSNPDLDRSLIEDGMKELRAAIAADPKDLDSLTSLVSMLRSLAERETKAGHDEASAKLRADAHDLLANCVAQNPDAMRIRFALLSDEMAESVASKRVTGTYLDVFKAHKDGINGIVAAIKAQPPEKTDPIVALAISPWISVLSDDGKEVARDLLAHVQKAHADDPVFLLGFARVEMQLQDFDRALELAKKVAALPDKPVSLDGWLLYNYRAQGVRLQADATFVRWEAEKDTAKKEALVKEINALRADLAGRIGETAPEVLSIDGRLLLIANDLQGARVRIANYNDVTKRTDVSMLSLEANLLERTNQAGAARSVYERILQLDRQNIRALIALGKIEADLHDYRSAAEHLTIASQLVPGDASVKEMAANAQMLATDDFAKDPVLGCLNESIKLASGLSGDQPAAIAKLRGCLTKYPGDIRLSLQLASLLAATKDSDGAKVVLDDAIKAHPENTVLKQKRAMFEGDPLALVLDGIDKTNATDIQKNLARWSVYMRVGKMDEAKAALAAAVAIPGASDMAPVIDAQFEDALIRKDQATMDSIAARAQALNLDGVGGQLYRSRALLASGKTRESVGLLREVASKDKNNLLAWRMLGTALMDLGKPAEAVDALSQAVSIKPNDQLSVNMYIRGKVALDQTAEALAFARKKLVELNGGDAEFTEMRLALEANAPGGDRDGAIKERLAMEKADPQNTQNLSKLASLLINAGRQEEALPYIDRISAKDPDDIVGVELRAAYLGRKKQYEEAVHFLKSFIEKLPEEKRTDELYINVGRLLTQLGQPNEARAMLEAGRKYQDKKTPDKKRMLIDRELGDILFGRGEWEASAEAYKHVIDGGSEDTENNVRKRILECYLKLKRYQDMSDMVAKLPQAVQGDATIILLLAEGASAQNDRTKALKLYDQAIAADPKSPIGYVKRGQFNMSTASATNNLALLKDAESDMDQAIRVDPTSIVARMLKSNILKQTGRDALAVALIKECVGLDPFNETLRLRLVQACEEVGRLQDAAVACDDAVKQFPTSPAWKLKAGQAWGRVGNWARAVDHLMVVFQERTGPETAVALLEAVINKGDITLAFNILNAAGQSFDVEKNLPVRMLRARIYAKQAQTAKAAQEINNSLAMVNQASYEDASIFMSGIAGVYPKRQDQIAALARIEGSKPFTGYLALKSCELRAREESSAAAGTAALETLAANDPDTRVRAGAWSLLGTFSYTAGNWEQARERFAKGIALDPDNIELNNNLAYVLAAKLNKGAEALPYAQKSSKAAPLNSGFQDTLGICQMTLKDYPAALTTFNSALQLATNDSERVPVYIHLGWLKLKQGDKVDARRFAAQARELITGTTAGLESFKPDLQELDAAIDGK